MVTEKFRRDMESKSKYAIKFDTFESKTNSLQIETAVYDI